MALSKAEVADALGVTIRTVNRWRALGCPRVEEAGEERYVVDQVQAWLDSREGTAEAPHSAREESEPPAPSTAVPTFSSLPPRGPTAVTKETRQRAEVAKIIASTRMTELEVQQEKNLRDRPLAELIRAATTLEDLGELTTEILALVGEGSLRPVRANALHKLLVERRQQLKAQEHDRPDPLGGKVLLCTAEVEPIVRAFEAIYSDERRARVANFLLEVYEEDLAEAPATDTSPGARLDAPEVSA